MPTLRAFDGGLNTRVDAHLIRETEARMYVNINNDTAVLTPIKDKITAVNTISRYSHYNTITDTWLSESTPHDWLEYQGVLYKADRVNAPTQFRGATEYNLGIAAPTGSISMSATSAPLPIEQVTFTSTITGGSADLPAGTHKYKIINRSSVNGYVSTSYFTFAVEETSVKPGLLRGKYALRNSRDTKYGVFRPAVVSIGDDSLTIDVSADTNADEFRAFRYFDGAWRAIDDWQDASVVITDDTYDISANDALEEDEHIVGTLQYAVTFYSSTTGAESSVLLTDELEVENGDITLTNIPVSTDPQVTHVNIYRIGNNITAFTKVDQITNGTTTYVDTLGDTQVEGSLLASQDYDPAPAGLKYLTEAYAMLFGAVGPQLRFTPIGVPQAWPTQYFLDFPENITGISKTPIGLLVHTYYTTFLVTGTGPTSFAQQPLATDQGCISHDSVQGTKDTAIWASTDGICLSDGSDVAVISRDKLGKLSLDPVTAELFDQVYQLLLSDGTVLAFDFERRIFKQFDYGTDYLVCANDKLYGHSDGVLYELNADSADYADINYISPDLEGSSLTQKKIYTDVRFYSVGQITVTVFVNGEAVGSKSVTTEDSHLYKIPQNKSRGNFISFQVTGNGIVRELMWEEETANA